MEFGNESQKQAMHRLCISLHYLLNANQTNLLGNTQTLLFNIIFSLTCFSSVAAVIRELQFKEWCKTDEYTLPLNSTTRVSLQAKDTLVLDKDWPVKQRS
jgi:hypothetical protein